MRRFALLTVFAFLTVLPVSGAELWLRQPALSRDQIAFAYAGDLWVIPRAGGDARRLTTGLGLEADPRFSPDGRWIAFTANYAGNYDVYLVPAEGGMPRRLTWHPGTDRVAGWTPDGKRVLFYSARSSFQRLYTMPLAGGLPDEVPLPHALQGSFSPDGERLAYVPHWQRTANPMNFRAWKHYRGGRTSPVWIARLSDSAVQKVPRENSNDSDPMWIGDRVYFLSDRNGATTLFSYDVAGGKVVEALRNDGPDIVSASAGPGGIVYDQFGKLYLFDLASGRSQPVEARVTGDLAAVRPYYAKIADHIESAVLSPTGVRVAFEARGEILTVPAEKGDARNLTRTPGVAERSPAWSPDGQRIAFFSDESGEYALHVADQTGLGKVSKISLGRPPSFFYYPRWSPDGSKIAFTDKRLNLWYVDVEKGKPVRVDTDLYETPFRLLEPVWSPDSRWIAYTKDLRSHLRAVFVYSLDTGKARQITDGMSDARYVAFDRGGKYLYFTASTDAGPTAAWLDLSSVQRPVSRSVYVAVLDEDLPSPLAPQSDEEKAPQENKKGADGKGDDEEKEKDSTPARVKIGFDGIDQRVLALPIPPRNYTALFAGKEGVLFVLESAPIPGFGFEGSIVHRFDLESRKTEKLLEGVTQLDVSRDGEKMLVRQGKAWSIFETAKPPEAGKGGLGLEGVEVLVDPRAEWRQMYHEVWRIERDFFYDPGLHGVDLAAAAKRYEPYLDAIGHRADLNALFNEMLGELTVGHLYIGGGDAPEVPIVKGGLLGADYEVANGRYRFARIYNGENWNPALQAPLTQPGVNVKPGEYLLSVNGAEVRAGEDVDVYSFFEATAGKSVVLEVGPDPDGKGARKVTVVPIENELELRTLAWMEENRRKVDAMSKGRLAYVYLPDTGEDGYTSFNRYFFAQVGRDGAVIDERFNGGGYAADYIVDHLRRPLLNYISTREGEDFTTPVGSIFGPKVMLINESAGSGGDALPWYFRQLGIGPLIGTRTWGGLVGIYDYPPLIGGGFVTAPRVAFWNTAGEWEVENHGIAPDIEVELDPQAWRQGHDAQLEKAVQVALELLEKNPPPPKPKRPAYPNYHRKAGG
jgi:tricorn protease